MESYCINKNSVIPALRELERFGEFLNKKFSLNLPASFLITITSNNGKNKMGWFIPQCNWENGDKKLNSVNIASQNLKDDPLEIVAHELAHYVNFLNKIKDTSQNGYHNKKFLVQAEVFGLTAERDTKGYGSTKRTDKFNSLISEFSPNMDVFNIKELPKEPRKNNNRNFLFLCPSQCYKIRCGDRELKATCGQCGGVFSYVGQ